MAERVAVVAVVLAVALAGVAAAAPVASSAGPDAETAPQQAPVNDTDIAPGERMAGVVGAEKAAVESEVAVRAFERRVARANSASSKAKVVGTEVEDLQSRLDELAEREAELREARENGTLSTGEYRARLAQLYAEQRALERLTNRTERVARDLPEQALRQQGVNATRLQRLRSQARNLTGPEVAAIARGIAGKGVGRPAGAGPPEFVENRTRGPGAGNGTGPPDERGPPGNRTGGPPGNETGPPAAPGNGTDRGNGNGPGNETGGPSDPGNGTGPPDRAGDPNGNGTDSPDRERGPPGNETGPPDDPGNGTGPGDAPGNGTGGGDGSAPGNGTDGDNESGNGDGGGNGNPDNGDGGDSSNPGNGNDGGDGGNGSDPGNGNDATASRALRLV